MTRSLILALSADPSGPVSWAMGSQGGDTARVHAHGRLDSAGDLTSLDTSKVDRVIAIVPGCDVLAREVSLPARHEAEARAALPFLLEDDLASDPEALHFALGTPGEDGTRRVAVVSREAMERWRGLLAPLGLKNLSIIPDFEALDRPGEGCRVVALDDRVVMVPAKGAGVSADPALAPLVFADMADGTGKVRIHAQDAEGFIREAGLNTAALERAPALSDTAFLSEAMGVMNRARVVDLMQGAFTKAGDWGTSLTLWRRAGILAGLAALAYVITLGGQAWRYDQQADKLTVQAESTFRTAFPDVRRVVNPRAQMRSKLATLKAGGSDLFLKTSGLLYAGLSDIPAVEVRDIRFFAERGTLTASLSYSGFQDLERLKTAISQLGGHLEEGGSRQADGRMLGDVTIGLR